MADLELDQWQRELFERNTQGINELRQQLAATEARDALKAELERVYAHNHDLEDAIAMGEHTVEVLEGRVKKLESELRANTHVCTIQMDQARQAEMERDDVKRKLETARVQIERYGELARWIERDMLTPAHNTCHIPWEALEELVALAKGAEPPNCAVCRRDNCWPDCARFYDQPDGTGEVKGDG